jgi:pyridoxal phosphate enzyme (YggS family)
LAIKNFYRQKIEYLKSEIEKSCRKSNRDPESVTLIAASKYADPSQIADVINSGIMDLGENRADEFEEKYSILGNLAKKASWHFIGHLQSRKARTVVPLADYIHSIDSISTVEEVDKQAFKAAKIQKVLVEVNISGEETKYGIHPAQAEYFIKSVNCLKNVQVCGLMVMAPLSNDEKVLRNIFHMARELRDRLVLEHGLKTLKELSMGMSNDFRIAIEEGATMVRIGSLIFL